jgi:hypothetical protein
MSKDHSKELRELQIAKMEQIEQYYMQTTVLD